jgi:hypothetical protein
MASSFCAVCGREALSGRLCSRHKDCTPAEQLRIHLLNARTGGVDFHRAWDVAFKRVVWPHDTGHRRDWKAILDEKRGDWRRAYDGEPQEPRRLLVAEPFLLVA